MPDEVPKVTSPTPPPVVATPVKPPVITSKNLPPELPKPGTPAAVAAEQVTIDDDSDIVAKPLVSPDFTKLQPTNPAMVLRGINRLALGGQRFEEAKVQGYIICKPSDIKNITSVMNVKDATVTYGDLIFIMMPRIHYILATKHN